MIWSFGKTRAWCPGFAFLGGTGFGILVDNEGEGMQMTADEIWERRLEAEVYSLYFADLATCYTTQKQWITGISLFLSTTAAATVLGKVCEWIPFACSLIVAAATSYSFAVGLDKKVATLAKLHSEWNGLADDYASLWHQWYEPTSEAIGEGLNKRARELSFLATTEVPNKKKRIDYWSDVVYDRYRHQDEKPTPA